MRILPKSQHPVADPGRAWIRQVQKHLEKLLLVGHTKTQHLSPDEWQTIKSRWRDLIFDSTTELRQTHGKPVNATVHGEQDYDGFRVQKITFEACPGWVVGLNLYLPLGDGPFTPIICPCGHGPKWQDDHQIAPQILAKAGFATALFDMPMFGERSAGNDHFIQGAQAQMIGLWSAFFFLVDALRAADYLETRPDITFDRGMGVTGVSGGGLATLFLAQLDMRVKAIVPVCSVNPLGSSIIRGLYTGCPENYLRGQALLGMDIDDLLTLAAPLPCLVIGGTEDTLFRTAHMRQSVKRARAMYRQLHANANLDAYYEECGHRYTATMAVEAARWFRRWLLDDTTTPLPAPEIALLSEADLNCGTAERTETMQDYLRREVARMRQVRKVATRNENIMELFGVLANPRPVTVENIVATTEWEPEPLRKQVMHVDGDLSLPLLRLDMPGAPDGTLVCFSEDGKFSPLRQCGGFFGLCQHIISADLRGFGELTPEHSSYDIYGWCGIDRALADLLWLAGAVPMGQQIEDALRVLNHLEADGPLTVYGKGEAALPALFAGLLCPRVDRIVLDRFPCAFERLAAAPAPAWSRFQFVPGVLKYFDLPDIFIERADKQFLLLNPCGPDRRPFDEVAALRLYGLDAAHITVQVDVTEQHPAAAIRTWWDTPVIMSAPVDPTLAAEGGTPVRTRPFPTRLLGAGLTGVGELHRLEESVASRTLFRHYGLGTPVMAETLERRVRETFDVSFALGVTSGSAALNVALAGLSIGPGDEVILPAFAWFSCFNAIVLHGALPVFCEIDRSLNIDPCDAEKKITPRTKAIIAIHYQGAPANLDELLEIAHARGIAIVEDCAQGLGAQYHDRYVGGIGDVGTFSLQGNKMLTAGEGGLVVTNDPVIFERCVRYHDLGFVRPTFAAQLGHAGELPEFPGNQYRMNELTAAVMLAQFDRLDWMLGRCRRVWSLIREKVSAAVPDARFRRGNCPRGDAGIALFLDLETPERAAEFTRLLTAEGVPAGLSSGMTNLLVNCDYVRHARLAHPALPPFAPGCHGEHVTYTPDLAPNTQRILDSQVGFGLGPRYTPADADDIANAIIKVYRVVTARV